MNLRELKTSIEENRVGKELLIFRYTDTDFLARQYYHRIAKDKGLSIEMVDDISVVISNATDIFGMYDFSASMTVLRVDEFDTDYLKLFEIPNLVIVCKKIGKPTEQTYSHFIYDLPKLEDWCLKDYAYSICNGVDTNKLDWVISLCNNDINRLQMELDKIMVIDEKNRNAEFDKFITDGVFNDLSTNTIFDITNAIMKRDFQTIARVYKDLDKMDSNEMGFLAILYNGFKNVINIQLGNNPTPESCGLKPGMFWAIKKNNVGYYSKEQLIDIFGIITEIDQNIKIGEMPMNIMLDYVLTKICNLC